MSIYDAVMILPHGCMQTLMNVSTELMNVNKCVTILNHRTHVAVTMDTISQKMDTLVLVCKVNFIDTEKR